MNVEKFKLYHSPATRSGRVKWILHELLDDNFEVEVVSLHDGVQYSAEYMQKNPNHCVPVLEITMTNGESMTMIESGAMVTFLADAFPGKNLAPSAHELSLVRADYLQMLHFGASWMDMMLWQIRAHEHILPKSERDARTIARYRKKFIDEAEPQIKARLQNTAFICGEAFTAADCVIGHNVMWARAYGLCDDAVFSQYLSTVSKRAAFLSAFADAREFTVAVPEGSPLKNEFTG